MGSLPPGLLAGPSPATEAEVVEVEAEQLPSGIVGVGGAERSVSFSRFGSSSSIPVGRNGTVAMASDSYDSGGKNKSLKTARRLLEVTSTTEAEAEAEQLPSLPSGFYDAFVLRGIRVVQALQPGTLLCHFTVPSRLLNSGGFLHGGATASLVDLVASAAFATAGLRTRGSPLEMNISYLDAAFADEEIDIEAKVLRAGKAIGVAVVELKKKSGKIIAQARYSKYLGVASSKL